MTTSARQSLLSEPTGDAPLSERALTYVGTMTRMEFHQLVLEAFEESGISKSTLAKRLRKRPEQITRLLGGPGNWTIDTAAELLFAIDGSLVRLERRWPMRDAARNHTGTHWSTMAPITTTSGQPNVGIGSPKTATRSEIVSVD